MACSREHRPFVPCRRCAPPGLLKAISVSHGLGRRELFGLGANHAIGWVYFIQAAGGGLVKIGTTYEVSQRLATLQNACPVELQVLTAWRTIGTVEHALHAYFAASRRHGEWFEPTAELLQLVGAIRNSEPDRPLPVAEIRDYRAEREAEIKATVDRLAADMAQAREAFDGSAWGSEQRRLEHRSVTSPDGASQ